FRSSSRTILIAVTSEKEDSPFRVSDRPGTFQTNWLRKRSDRRRVKPSKMGGCGRAGSLLLRRRSGLAEEAQQPRQPATAARGVPLLAGGITSAAVTGGVHGKPLFRLSSRHNYKIVFLSPSNDPISSRAE